MSIFPGVQGLEKAVERLPPVGTILPAEAFQLTLVAQVSGLLSVAFKSIETLVRKAQL